VLVRKTVTCTITLRLLCPVPSISHQEPAFVNYINFRIWRFNFNVICRGKFFIKMKRNDSNNKTLYFLAACVQRKVFCFLLETACILWAWKSVCHPKVRRERWQYWTCEKSSDRGTALRNDYSPLQKYGMWSWRLKPAGSGRVPLVRFYEGWNFNSGNYLFTTDTK